VIEKRCADLLLGYSASIGRVLEVGQLVDHRGDLGGVATGGFADVRGHC
jgi:hypothetical protein